MAEDNVNVLATICARGGSKGVPGKNIRKLLGKPLILYTLETALDCPAVTRTIVSTDSDEIADVVEAAGFGVPFRRPSEISTDTAPKIQAIAHATYFAEKSWSFFPDIIVDLDVGAPLRTVDDITSCVNVLMENPDLDAAVTIYDSERNPYFNMVEQTDGVIKLVKGGYKLVCRQSAPEVFSISGSVFAWRRKSLESVTHLFEGKWGACKIPRERAIDIDFEMDFQFVEFLLSKKKNSTFCKNKI